MVLAIDLSERVILVLGGSRGIGAGVVRALCAAGAHVVFTHTGNPQTAPRVEALLQEVRSAGGSVEEAAVDALDSAGTASLAGRVAAERGGIQGLVCNVGKNKAREVAEVSDQDWRRFLDLNLSSAFYGVRAVLPHMLAGGYGRIVLVGSSAVYDGGGGAADYAAAKAGLNGLMSYICRTHARRGVHANVIHPAVIETDLLRERYGTPERKKGLLEQIPAGRLGRPEDVAALTAFLLSPWGDYVCGQAIVVDGGRTLFNR